MLIVLGIGGNFAAGHIYRNAAAGHVAAGNAAQLRALQTAARHRADMATAEATLTRTLQAISASLPETSKQQGARNAARWLAANFEQPQNGDVSPANLQRLMEALDVLLSEEDEEPEPFRRYAISENGHG
jgi:hypothetical protein